MQYYSKTTILQNDKMTSANIHYNACNNDAIHAIQQNNNATINTKYDKGTILHCVQQLIIRNERISYQAISQ